MAEYLEFPGLLAELLSVIAFRVGVLLQQLRDSGFVLGILAGGPVELLLQLLSVAGAVQQRLLGLLDIRLQPLGVALVVADPGLVGFLHLDEVGLPLLRGVLLCPLQAASGLVSLLECLVPLGLQQPDDLDDLQLLVLLVPQRLSQVCNLSVLVGEVVLREFFAVEQFELLLLELLA